MKRILLATTLLAGFGSAPAIAQTADGAAPRRVDTVIVSAQRRDQDIQATPVAVTAVGEAQLEQLSVTSTQDIAKAVPNLTLNPVTANPSTFQIGLRGGSEQTGGLIVSEPVVGIYVDDVYRGRLQGSNVQLSDIERIEVLRGPQGTLYGRNTFSGAIKIITKTPGQNNEWLNASLGVGSFGEIRADASVGRALTDTLAGSLSVMWRDQQEGWIRNRATGREIGAERNVAARGKLVWESGPWTVTGAVAWTDDDNDGYIPVNVVFNPDAARINFATRVRTRDASPATRLGPYVTSSPTISAGATEVLSASLTIERELGENLTFKSITGYVDTDDLFRWDLAGGFQPTPTTFRSTFDRLAVASAQQWSQELQLSGQSLGGDLNWIAGLYWFNETGDQSFSDTIALFGLPTFPLFLQSTDTTSWAAFVHGAWSLSPQTALTVGLRYTSEDKDFAARILSTPAVNVRLGRTDDDLSPKLGIEHSFSDTVFGYANVQRGFKAGGFNGLSRDPRVLALSYRPQTVWAYEAGLKADLLDNTLRANFAIFLNDIKDLQQTTTRPDGTFPQENVGDATVWGWELELSATPADGLDLFAAIGFMDDQFDRLDPTSDALRAGAQNLPLVSDWTARIGGSYAWDVGERFTGKLGASVAYTGAFDATVTNVLEISDYARFDGFASIGTRDGKWELVAAGQNLTDEVTYVSGIVAAPFPPALTVLKPRTWTLTLRYKN
jgi:iron complex outermembrane recepter protein